MKQSLLFCIFASVFSSSSSSSSSSGPNTSGGGLTTTQQGNPVFLMRCHGYIADLSVMAIPSEKQRIYEDFRRRYPESPLYLIADKPICTEARLNRNRYRNNRFLTYAVRNPRISVLRPADLAGIVEPREIIISSGIPHFEESRVEFEGFYDASGISISHSTFEGFFNGPFAPIIKEVTPFKIIEGTLIQSARRIEDGKRLHLQTRLKYVDDDSVGALTHQIDWHVLKQEVYDAKAAGVARPILITMNIKDLYVPRDALFREAFEKMLRHSAVIPSDACEYIAPFAFDGSVRVYNDAMRTLRIMMKRRKDAEAAAKAAGKTSAEPAAKTSAKAAASETVTKVASEATAEDAARGQTRRIIGGSSPFTTLL